LTKKGGHSGAGDENKTARNRRKEAASGIKWQWSEGRKKGPIRLDGGGVEKDGCGNKTEADEYESGTARTPIRGSSLGDRGKEKENSKPSTAKAKPRALRDQGANHRRVASPDITAEQGTEDGIVWGERKSNRCWERSKEQSQVPIRKEKNDPIQAKEAKQAKRPHPTKRNHPRKKK